MNRLRRLASNLTRIPEDPIYETGRKATETFKQDRPIPFDDLLPKWNYRIVPQAN